MPAGVISLWDFLISGSLWCRGGVKIKRTKELNSYSYEHNFVRKTALNSAALELEFFSALNFYPPTSSAFCFQNYIQTHKGVHIGRCTVYIYANFRVGNKAAEGSVQSAFSSS